MRLATQGRLAGACALAGDSLLASGAPALPQPPGRDVYVNICAECHQANGEGVPGDAPPLSHDPVVSGPPDKAARVVLEGSGPMPNFDAELSDAQIAAVLTYVRSSFGNAASPVSPALVTGVRNDLAHGH